MATLTDKTATKISPQVVTLIVDDSGSMKGQKAKQVTAGTQDLVITLQAVSKKDHQDGRYRYLLNVASFGSQVTAIATATPPHGINLDSLNFTGGSGQTEMALALRWAKEALQQSLDRCRSNSDFLESETPPPLCVFFSDGENTGPDVEPDAIALRSVPFKGGSVDVVACGVGMEQKDFPVMLKIASRPQLAINIDPDRLEEFLAVIGETAEKNKKVDAALREHDFR